jgi:hypothetical protein
VGHHDKALQSWQDVLRIRPDINKQTLSQLTNRKEIQQLQALNVL